jgi:hypothetical protein
MKVLQQLMSLWIASGVDFASLVKLTQIYKGLGPQIRFAEKTGV